MDKLRAPTTQTNEGTSFLKGVTQAMDQPHEVNSKRQLARNFQKTEHPEIKANFIGGQRLVFEDDGDICTVTYGELPYEQLIEMYYYNRIMCTMFPSHFARLQKVYNADGHIFERRTQIKIFKGNEPITHYFKDIFPKLDDAGVFLGQGQSGSGGILHFAREYLNHPHSPNLYTSLNQDGEVCEVYCDEITVRSFARWNLRNSQII